MPSLSSISTNCFRHTKRVQGGPIFKSSLLLALSLFVVVCCSIQNVSAMSKRSSLQKRELSQSEKEALKQQLMEFFNKLKTARIPSAMELQAWAAEAKKKIEKMKPIAPEELKQVINDVAPTIIPIISSSSLPENTRHMLIEALKGNTKELEGQSEILVDKDETTRKICKSELPMDVNTIGYLLSDIWEMISPLEWIRSVLSVLPLGLGQVFIDASWDMEEIIQSSRDCNECCVKFAPYMLTVGYVICLPVCVAGVAIGAVSFKMLICPVLGLFGRVRDLQGDGQIFTGIIKSTITSVWKFAAFLLFHVLPLAIMIVGRLIGLAPQTKKHRTAEEFEKHMLASYTRN